jgi:hypothetical protein
LSAEIEEHIAAVETFYRLIILGAGSRLESGAKLWRQYQKALKAYRRGASDFLSVYERINEMAAAHVLFSDPTLHGATIAYETPIAADRSLIDFTVWWPDGRALYIEVKTVHPRTEDSEVTWARHKKRSALHPENVHYIVCEGRLGGKLSGDSFSARSSFMTYSRQFEERLAAANKVRPGEGVLLVCGTGMEWHLSKLEDFVDFYRLGVHREDDSFAKMEAHDFAQPSIELKRNIAKFAYIKRPMDHVMPETWCSDVQGPMQGRGTAIAPFPAGPGVLLCPPRDRKFVSSMSTSRIVIPRG